MGYVKVVKTKAYFKRYQTKFKRRRQGKTDYYARKRLVTQAKNKYNTPKYRLVVRFTNKDVICQIVYTRLVGDIVMTSAYAHELKDFGLTLGLTNYAASYATGLLLARRHLKKINLDTKYQGRTEIDGSDWQYDPEELEFEGGPAPFKCNLDVGLARTTTGARVFAAMKGACDGGINVPHSDSRFVGYSGDSLKSEKLRHYIFGGHVGDYMRLLTKNNPTKFQKQFSQYIAAGVGPDDLEAMYGKVHAAIRANPMRKKKEEKVMKEGYKPKRYNKKKRSLAQRKARIRQIKESRIRNAQ